MSYFRMDIARRTLIAALGFSLVNTGAGAAAKGTCSGERIEIYRSGDKWRWRLFARNGEQIAEHSQPYDTEQACRDGIDSVKRAVRSADVIKKSDCGPG